MEHKYFFGYSNVSKENWNRAFGKKPASIEPDFIICTDDQRETAEKILMITKENDEILPQLLQRKNILR